jgi:hypothetical protein
MGVEHGLLAFEDKHDTASPLLLSYYNATKYDVDMTGKRMGLIHCLSFGSE